MSSVMSAFVRLLRVAFSVLNKIKKKGSTLSNFHVNTYDNATLYVPEGTIEQYKALEGWKDFQHIEEGVPSKIANINKQSVKVKNDGGVIIVEGAIEGTPVNVYSTDGLMVGNAVSRGGIAIVTTVLKCGSMAVVKIGELSMKFVVK